MLFLLINITFFTLTSQIPNMKQDVTIMKCTELTHLQVVFLH